jgi:hypothetical protein
MSDEKPLTRSELIAVLEEVGVATKEDVEKAVYKTVSEATDAIIRGLDAMDESVRTEIKASSDTLDTRLKGIEIELRGLKNDIEGLHAELSDKAPRKELNELKTRVTKYHPLS